MVKMVKNDGTTGTTVENLKILEEISVHLDTF
jgi:hypothetical protein